MSPAWIEVACPAEVMLTIQGHPMRATGPLRLFASPPLPPGQVFTYQVVAFLAGRELAVRHVDVEAGKTSRIAIELDDAVVNYGVDVEQLRNSHCPSREPEAATPSTVRRGQAPRSKPPPAHRHRRPRTIAAAPREELAGPLHDLAGDYVVQDYAPDHWAVAKPGFVTTGHPTIYVQEPDGRVLFRQDDLTGLHLNLEAVRKPSPDYKPDRDPDYRQPFGLAGWEAWLPILSISRRRLVPPSVRARCACLTQSCPPHHSPSRDPSMTLPPLPTWIWPALALAAALSTSTASAVQRPATFAGH